MYEIVWHLDLPRCDECRGLGGHAQLPADREKRYPQDCVALNIFSTLRAQSHMVPCRARTMATSTWLMFFRLNSITETQQTAVRSRYPHVTTARAGRSAVSSASDSMTVVGAAAALSCLAKLVGLCGRGVTCRSRLQGRGMYRVSKSEQSWCT